MRLAKTAYELSESQVSTPPRVISLFWELVRQFRPYPARVLDLGAGDGRFAKDGQYLSYAGVEIDPRASRSAVLPSNAKLHTGCAFQTPGNRYDICLGNPPYVRHHDIERPWRKRIAGNIQNELGLALSGIGNLYLYFLCLGLMKTHAQGLVALIIPFEWVSRPSAKPIRQLITTMGWNVSIYRFEAAIFDDVLTTASITIIDKNNKNGAWNFLDISPDFKISVRSGISGNRHSLLPYSLRGRLWARRGISPGGQKTFTLTEEERIRAGLHKRDVLPCVTTLRNLPTTVRELNWKVFKCHFVDAGQRCWLVKSANVKLSERVRKYLRSVHKEGRQTYACMHQHPWYRYENPPVPKLVFHSGFMKRGPKIVLNSIGAQVVGSVYGIHSKTHNLSLRRLRDYLAKYDFEKRIVAHARTLRKVEVAQLNSVLSHWHESVYRDG